MTCHELKVAVLNLRHVDSIREFHYGNPTSFHDMSGLCKYTVYGEYSALYHIISALKEFTSCHNMAGAKNPMTLLCTMRTNVRKNVRRYLHT